MSWTASTLSSPPASSWTYKTTLRRCQRTKNAVLPIESIALSILMDLPIHIGVLSNGVLLFCDIAVVVFLSFPFTFFMFVPRVFSFMHFFVSEVDERSTACGRS